jgi:hypothetical protein
MNPAETAAISETAPPRRGWLRTGLRFAALIPVGLALLLLSAWAVGALCYDVRLPWLRAPLAAGYILALLALWIFEKRRWLAAGLTVLGFGLVLAWWLSLAPSNAGDWQSDVAVLPYANINGDQVTIYNIRNCDYRTETDFDVRHYDKTLDLNRLRTMDLFMVYWGSPYMAHTMISFGFEGGEFICFSIETRKQKSQSYSAIRGLFRQFTLTYIVADERDLIRLRTNYRHGEEVYLFRLRGSPARTRALFLSYLNRMNDLRERPEWYNAVTDNCTTGIRNQRAAVDRVPWNWRMLVNGLGDTLLYERGLIDTNLPLVELKSRCHVNEKGREAGQASDFSAQIRRGVPGIKP